MSQDLFSPSWYRVADLKPRIRSHSRIHRHLYRDELWYVLHDHITGNVYRFTPVAYRIIGMMDGERTVQNLWEHVSEQFGDEAPTQSDMVRLLSQLHAADVLVCDVPPDTRELLLRGQKKSLQRTKSNIGNPFFLRFPLLDPEKFLSRTISSVQFIFSRPVLILWILTISAAIVLTWQNWHALTTNVGDRVFARENLLILWFVYPVVKGLHELGHAYAVKKWGGEVHEMGIMLLVFMPIPYVDASSAAVFGQRSRRIVVDAAGIAIELFMASLALFLWVSLEPGLVRSVAFNVMLIGGVSTVLFNGNPLLRYDGYYILSDLLDIPNLAQRSLGYLGYLVNRYAYGIKKIQAPYSAPGERFWFVFYAVASFIYRIFVYAAIILFVAGKFFFIGVLLGIWGVFSMIVTPLSKKIHNLFNAPLYEDNRGRALLVTVSVLSSLLVLLFLIPLPHLSRTEGVVWVPEESMVRSGTNGIIRGISSPPGSHVKKGDVLIECEDPLLAADIAMFSSQLREFENRYKTAFVEDMVQAKIIKEQIESIRKKLSRAEGLQREMKIVSPGEGEFVLPKAVDLEGRFLHQGDLVGYVIEDGGTTIRIVVPQRSVDLIRKRTRGVELRVADKLKRIYSGQIIREVPGALDRLPSAVLGMAGGGEIAIDPTDKNEIKTFEKTFQFDLSLDEPLEQKLIGSRVYVRFHLGYEPVAFRWYRSVRQLFLKRFNV